MADRHWYYVNGEIVGFDFKQDDVLSLHRFDIVQIGEELPIADDEDFYATTMFMAKWVD